MTDFVYCRIKTCLEKNQSAQLVPIAQPSEKANQWSQPPSGNKSVFSLTKEWTAGTANILENGVSVS